MPLFGPGIGEKNMYPLKARRGDHRLKYFHRVMFYDTDIIEPPFFDFPKEPSYTGPEYFDTYIIFFGVFLGNHRGGEPHPKADFYGHRVFVAKKHPKIEGSTCKGNSIPGSEDPIGPPLGVTHPSPPEDIAFYPEILRKWGGGYVNDFRIHTFYL
jgi:hypothetical protein